MEANRWVRKIRMLLLRYMRLLGSDRGVGLLMYCVMLLSIVILGPLWVSGIISIGKLLLYMLMILLTCDFLLMLIWSKIQNSILVIKLESIGRNELTQILCLCAIQFLLNAFIYAYKWYEPGVDADNESIVYVTDSEGTINGYKFVDLGLSVLWATENLGAVNPHDVGEYFKWGNLGGMHSSKGNRYNAIMIVDNENVFSHDDVRIYGNVKYDPVRSRMGGRWRLPRGGELEELKRKCKWELATVSDQLCYKVTGPNGNHILLPLSGYYDINKIPYISHRNGVTKVSAWEHNQEGIYMSGKYQVTGGRHGVHFLKLTCDDIEVFADPYFFAERYVSVRAVAKVNCPKYKIWIPWPLYLIID